tara:strand:- start:897 stop:1367 length:471 start_codon:yes stop_codon:yes gene_type:complete
MAKIKPTFTLTANKSTASSNPGPLSVALALNTTQLLDVDTVTSEILTVPFASASDAPVLLIDGSAYVGSGDAGTDGGYIYMKNITASGSNEIYIGVHPPGLTDLDATGTGGGDEAHRFCTLKVGEFAFFPFDYTQDISVDADAANQKIEYWLFDRA